MAARFNIALGALKKLKGSVMNICYKILLVPIFFFLLMHCSKDSTEPESNTSNWSRQESNVINDLEEVYFIDPNTGWAVGANGLVLHTSDGGNNWQTINTPVTSKLMTVYFLDENTGWVMGWNQHRLFTQDNGKNWVVESDGNDLYYKDLHFVNDSVGYALRFSTGQILKTTNRGNTWFFKNISNPQGAPNDVYFIDKQRGWVTGTQSYIARTRDGGETFETVLAPSGYSFFEKPVFVNDNIGWIIANSCWILSTNNGGQDWNIQVECGAESGFLNDLFFLNENIGWVVGGENSSGKNISRILHTSDGGNSWIEEEVNFEVELKSVFFIDQSTGWAVGRNGIILKFRG